MTDTPAPHTPSDDPRVDILAEALCDLAPAWTEERGVRWRGFASDILARLDAAVPARDDAPVPELWWSPADGPIVRETRKGSAFYGEYRPANTVRWMTELPADAIRLVSARDDALARWLDTEIAEVEAVRGRARSMHLYDVAETRANALREVRDRLDATTNTTPEEG